MSTTNLALPKFRYVTMAEYQAIPTKDALTIYFIKGTSLVYKGDAPYGSTIKRVSSLPLPEAAISELHYAVTTGAEAGIYVLNGDKDGFDNIAISKAYIDNKIKDLFEDVDYDAETANLTFTRQDGSEKVINLPKDNFLSAATFNTESNILTLELVDGTKVDVPLTELLNVYTGGETDTAEVLVGEDGEITVDVKKAPTVAIDENAAKGDAADAKSVYDLLKSMAWSETV